MRRTLLPAVLAVLLSVPSAHAAQGVNLRWDNCYGGGGTNHKAFACNTNSGLDNMYVSFQSANALHGVVGLELSVDIRSTSASMPAWWQVKSLGSCRQTALSATTAPSPMPTGCTDVFSPIAVLGLANPIVVAPDYTRLLIVIAVPEQDSLTLPANTEIFANRMTITHQKTVGTGACAGCAVPVCLGIHKIRVTRPVAYRNVLLYEEPVPGSSTVNWQGAGDGSTVDPNPQGNDPGPDRTVTCSLPVPARNRTWGTIKSLYH